MVDLNPVSAFGLDKISGQGLASAGLWLLIGVIFIAGIGFGLYWYYQKRVWNKTVTRFELIGDRYEPTFRDKAKSVKLGSGGFEVLFWQKAKVYRIAYGQRIGKSTYYFFTAPDGYEYNGVLGKQIMTDGKIPIITSTTSMRSQYTALEKQIEALHGSKVTFWDKYGNWVISIAFMLIIGVLAWLIFKEWSKGLGLLPDVVDKIGIAVDKISNACTLANPNVGTLTPIT